MVTPDVATQPFLQLRDVVLPPPLPLLISLLLVLGLLHLSWRGARWLMRDNLRPVDHAAAFVCTIGLVAALLHALAWAGYASIPLLRSVGWGLIALAPIELWRWRGVSPTRLIQGHLQGASWSERLGFSVSLIITVALFGAGFGPLQMQIRLNITLECHWIGYVTEEHTRALTGSTRDWQGWVRR
jgi:hypothetical protein